MPNAGAGAEAMPESGFACPRHPDLAVVDLPGKGRGVIATTFIPAGTLLEMVPVVPLTWQDEVTLKATPLDPYVFKWRANGESKSSQENPDAVICAIVLGITSLVNHSLRPNADIEYDFARRTLSLISIKDIPCNEEVAYDYDCELWFEAKE